MAGTMSVVEHVVLFKIKEDAPEEKKRTMLRELNALKSLNGVLHLKAGPALHLWPSYKSYTRGFTHVLHSRYVDKAALAAYAVHPSHVDVVESLVKPLNEDVLAIDWEAEVDAPLLNHFGAKRLVACKLKSASGEQAHLLDIPGKASSGVNFSTRAKGLNYGLLAVFPSVKALQEVGDPEKLVQSAEENPLVEEVLVVDYATEEESERVESGAKM